MIRFPGTEMCSVVHRDAYLQGFLHRDISPGNILITEDPRFDGGMLIDWDLYKTGMMQKRVFVRIPSVCVVSFLMI